MHDNYYRFAPIPFSLITKWNIFLNFIQRKVFHDTLHFLINSSLPIVPANDTTYDTLNQYQCYSFTNMYYRFVYINWKLITFVRRRTPNMIIYSDRLFTSLSYILFDIKIHLVYCIFSVFSCLGDIFCQQHYTVSRSQRSTWRLT